MYKTKSYNMLATYHMHRRLLIVHAAVSPKPSKATKIERRLSISVGSLIGITDLVLLSDVLPTRLLLEVRCGAIPESGGDGGGSSLRVHKQPGRQYACPTSSVVAVCICSVCNGHGKNRAANGKAYGTMMDIGNGDGLASISRFHTSASNASCVIAESVRSVMM